MTTISPSLKLFLNLSIIQSATTRRFDGGLISLGLTEFIILYHLAQADDTKMRRIDLAEKVGLTASGITRLLAPMEKIGLVRREANAKDARVSLVAITASGKRMLAESVENAESIAEELLRSLTAEDIRIFSGVLRRMGGSIR